MRQAGSSTRARLAWRERPSIVLGRRTLLLSSQALVAYAWRIVVRAQTGDGPLAATQKRSPLAYSTFPSFPNSNCIPQKRDDMTAGKIVDNWLEHQGTKDQLPAQDFMAMNKVRLPPPAHYSM